MIGRYQRLYHRCQATSGVIRPSSELLRVPGPRGKLLRPKVNKRTSGKRHVKYAARASRKPSGTLPLTNVAMSCKFWIADRNRAVQEAVQSGVPALRTS